MYAARKNTQTCLSQRIKTICVCNTKKIVSRSRLETQVLPQKESVPKKRDLHSTRKVDIKNENEKWRADKKEIKRLKKKLMNE
jgi:hypothetical protein